MAKNNIHVVPRGEIWAVVREHAERASAVRKTQGQAIIDALRIAKQDKLELLIHRANGRIREKNSYGKDTYPPKG